MPPIAPTLPFASIVPVPGNVAAVRVASGILIGEQVPSLSFIDRAQRQHQTRTPGPHRPGYTARVPAGHKLCFKPAPRIQRLSRWNEPGSANVCCLPSRSTVTSIGEPFEAFTAFGTSVRSQSASPHLHDAVISLQRTRRRGTLYRGKHLNLLSPPPSSAGASPRPSPESANPAICAPVAAVLPVMAHVRVQGIGSAPRGCGYRQTPTSCKTPPRRTAPCTGHPKPTPWSCSSCRTSYSWARQKPQ